MGATDNRHSTPRANVTIFRLANEQGEPLDSFHIEFSPREDEAIVLSSRINSWKGLMDFLTQSLRLDHQDAEEATIKLQLEGHTSARLGPLSSLRGVMPENSK
jgi:hypothetical protein